MSAFTITSEDVVGEMRTPAPRRRHSSGRPSQKYDLAGAGINDKNHWLGADSLSPTATHSPDVLYRLRTRSRYETANNGYVLGLVRGRANNCIGTGPRLQLRFPETFLDADFQREVPVRPELARIVEQRWQDWCDAVNLVDKLHLLDRSETREGEVFATVDTNPDATPGTPQLDLRLYEADQCDDPIDLPEDNVHAGIRVDASGRPVAYYFLFQHPGDSGLSRFAFTRKGEWVPAAQVFHLFDPDRVGQLHGVPSLTPGLPLGAVMRRYTMASLGTAELQASIPATMESDQELPTGDDEQESGEIQDMTQIPFAHTVILVTPAGRKVRAFPATQPAPNYREFKAEVNTEMGRGINAPRNVSTGSSAEYNYSSGRLDHLPWQQAARIRRDRWRRKLLDRLFRLWYAEAVVIPGYLPEALPPIAVWRWRWRWDAFPSIDPLKDAEANKVRLETGQTTLDDVAGEDGKDWEEILEQQAREMRKRRELGLPEPGAIAEPAATPPADNAGTEDEEVTDAA